MNALKKERHMKQTAAAVMKKTKKQTRTAVATAPASTDIDDRYADFLSATQKHFDAIVVERRMRLFVTDAVGLWDAYLANAPPSVRKSRTCNSCKSFIQKFGALVTILPDGDTASAVWSTDAPPAYADAARAMKMIAERASITSVFRSSSATWGTPNTGEWAHVALTVPRAILSTSRLLTPGQEMAEKKEDFGMLARSLSDFDIDVVRKAVSLLDTEALYRSEKCLGVAKWLLALHEARAMMTKNKRVRANAMWLAVANAPTGYAHVRSSMIGTLLEDLAAGLPFADVKAKFAAKMHPLQYMRPTAAPSAGNIAQAEKIVDTLQSAGALARRFAKLEDIETVWRPKAPDSAASLVHGVFSHLAKRVVESPQSTGAPVTTMTWVKFAANVLPAAEQIDFYVPPSAEPYTAMVTAQNADAPNLLQWGNPVSHYVYTQGSRPAQWNLHAGKLQRVTAVSLRSWMWGDGAATFAHHGAGVVFVLDDCRDVSYAHSGGMFPEQMKSEYHPARRTLEAHFAQAIVSGKDDASACGIALTKGQAAHIVLHVTSHGMRTSYQLDRWD